ncbi:MAG: NDP-sugar dehydratase or epimerase [Candidatus Magasanikbacteria bacterium GW2011_GWA2_45_39]|uniref:NDP-sugar dehydratase or epimerase n=1 Tax=Candidatus Magasanikbacteria bacterium GW2011_GWA2_45_39 TaxID=1619041 RepID=A0A0G1MI53_9BACT|nr:MAG: NDP-sugar dehydratase or epimerase [Candidatus Magasanikbacteria bacterium GW2011_GWA2_45_39]
MKKIFITGGAGFIGYHLAKHLLTDPNNILVLTDNLQRGRRDDDFDALLTNDRVTFIQNDLTDPSVYKTFDTDFDHIYHLAAVNGTKLFYQMPQEVLRINTMSLVYILEWIRTLEKKPKLCFTSSNEAYAGALKSFGILPIPTPEQVPLVVSDPYNPRWSYAATKLVGELFVIHYAKAYDFPAVIVRPHNFYGPRAGFDHVLPEWSQKIVARQDPFVLYSPDETRTFCYITDAVLAMQMLMDSTKTNAQPIETVHISNTDEVTMQELVEKLFDVAGWRPKAFDIKPSPVGSVKRRLGDIAKIKNLIGWEPKTPLQEGLRKTFVWYREHPKK